MSLIPLCLNVFGKEMKMENLPKEWLAADEAAVKKEVLNRCGERAFEKAVGIEASDAIYDVFTEGGRVVAGVSGSSEYCVSVGLKGAVPSGDCDCPAAEDAIMCKHSAALTLRVLSEALKMKRTPLAPEKKEKGGFSLSGSIEELTAGLSREGLVAALRAVVGRDVKARAALVGFCAMEGSANGSSEEADRWILKRMDKVAGAVGFDSPKEWFQEMERASAGVLSMMRGRKKEFKAEVAGSLYSAFEKASATSGCFDGSNGYAGAAVCEAGQAFLKALGDSGADGSPYWKRFLTSEDDGIRWVFDMFDEIRMVLGRKGLESVAQAVEELEASGALKKPSDEMRAVLWSLGDLGASLSYAEGITDKRARAAFEFDVHKSQGGAKRALEAGIMAIKAGDARVEVFDFVAAGLTKAGLAKEVVELRGTVFENNPTRASYEGWKRASSTKGLGSVAEEALAILASGRAKSEPSLQGFRDRSLEARMLMDAGMWTEALEMVGGKAGVCGKDVAAVALECFPHVPAKAKKLLFAEVDSMLKVAAPSSYENACAVLKDALPRLPAEVATEWLTRLRESQAKRRTMMGMIDDLESKGMRKRGVRKV